MAVENPKWRRRVERMTPQWGQTSFLPYEVFSRIQLVGESGRPFIESSSYNPAQVPNEMVPSVHSDREGLLVNISAFREVAGVFDDVKGLVSHIKNTLVPYKSEATPTDISQVINTLTWLPYWMVMRADEPIQNGHIPTYITAAAKTSEGAARIFTYIEGMQIGLGKSPKKGSMAYRTTTNSEPFVREVFNNGYLVSEDHYGTKGITACPAPEQMIKDFAETLFEKPSKKEDEIGERLGLSSAEIQRVSLFSSAVRRIRLIDRLKKGLSEGQKLAVNVGENEKVMFLHSANAERSSLVDIMNEALGRQKSTTLVPDAFRRK